MLRIGSLAARIAPLDFVPRGHHIGPGASGRRGITFSANFMNMPAAFAFVAIPSEVLWSYLVFAVIIAIGVVEIFRRGRWPQARGWDKLILFGPIFYAAPIAAFGTEHFTITKVIAGIVPAWMPWHLFWAYFVGASFIAAGLSLVTGVQTRLAASLLALTFFLFIVLMDAPGFARHPDNRIAAALALRELSFCAGPLALAASLSPPGRDARRLTTLARYFIAVAVLFYSVEQFLHADHVPGIPLELVTPTYVPGHALWTYLAASVYAVAGLMLLLGWKPRAAATGVGLTVLLLVLIVYVPYAVVARASLQGFNYLADTLMYAGTVLLLAGALPRQA